VLVLFGIFCLFWLAVFCCGCGDVVATVLWFAAGAGGLVVNVLLWAFFLFLLRGVVTLILRAVGVVRSGAWWWPLVFMSGGRLCAT